MEQTKLESHIEASTNIATGFLISWCVWIFLVPVFWPQLKTGPQLGFWVTVLFTVTSYLRSYFWRRFFARGFHRVVHDFVRKYYS